MSRESAGYNYARSEKFVTRYRANAGVWGRSRAMGDFYDFSL